MLLAAMMAVKSNCELTKRGNAYFANIGTIAAPAYYKTVAVQISFSSYKNRYDELEEAKNGAMAQFNATLVKLNMADRVNITKRVIRRTERSQQRLKQAQQQLQTLINFSERDKRFAGVLLGLAGTVVAIGSAIYQSQQVTKLAENIGRVDHRVEMVVESLKKLEAAITQALDLEKAEIMEERLVYEINGIFDHSAEMIESLVNGIYAVRSHKLHPTVVPPHDMVVITEEITKHTKATKHSTVFSTNRHLEDYPLSYILKDSGMIVLVHVPFVADGQQMIRKLYHLQSAKFQLGNQFFDYYDEEKYFSVNVKEEVFASHTVEDLLACQKVGTTYICTEQTIMHKTPATCIESLFRLDTDRVKAICKKRHINDQLHAFGVGPTTFVTTKSDKARRNCNKGHTEDYALRRNKEIDIQRGCIIRTDDYIVAPPLTPTTAIRIATHTLSFRQTELKGYAVYSPTMNKSTDGLQLGPTVPYSSYAGSNQFEIIGIGAALILVIAAGLISLACYRRVRRRQAKDARRERRPPDCESTPIGPQLSGIGRVQFPASPPPTLCRSGYDLTAVAVSQGERPDQQWQDDVQHARVQQARAHGRPPTRRVRGAGRRGRGAASGGNHNRPSTPRRGEEEENEEWWHYKHHPDHLDEDGKPIKYNHHEGDTWTSHEEVLEDGRRITIHEWKDPADSADQERGTVRFLESRPDSMDKRSSCLLPSDGAAGGQHPGEQLAQVSVYQAGSGPVQLARSDRREEQPEESDDVGFRLNYHPPSSADSECSERRRDSFDY